jgi:AhpD family alkylhydroperoxidase
MGDAITFTDAEIQMLSLVAAFENDCSWCMAFHTAMAHAEGFSGFFSAISHCHRRLTSFD